ncbi:DUF4365 domain-containing protein [Georgenia yuyongxinii]|uniref:DUF4365 domain-containing protein n=1 Tax=Georgenia yuyongxinii TaxID=2589797 RepID=A0A552WXA9_9MICO|nr:DUF4365 domain-containing protein [Georgenia yuyongxinii]TRW47427.1 DUF4365 domain-containing protein [Georgenia yuyongxinii]
MIPGKPADFTLWRESTVPVFGIVHDPDADSLRWVDLSAAAVLEFDGYLSPIVTGPFGKASVPVPDDNRMDLDVLPFVSAAKTALRRRSGSLAAALLSDDVDTVKTGIADTFAVGRHDPTAFLLLASLFQRLPSGTRRFAAETLAMTTSHPDVFWTRQNWIPDTIRAGLRQRLRWTESDIVALLTEIDEAGIQRGTIGQTIYHVLAIDQQFQSKLSGVALNRTVPDGARLWAAAILLYRAGEDAQEALERLVSSDEVLESDGALFPARLRLHEIDGFEHLVQSVADFGYVDLF